MQNIEIYEKHFHRLVQIILSRFIEIEKMKSLTEYPNQADYFKIQEEAKDIAKSVDSSMTADPIDDDGFIKIHLTVIFDNKTAIHTLRIDTSKEYSLKSIHPAMNEFARSACHNMIVRQP